MDDWSEELVDIEAAAKNSADYLLFVIDNQTRALASIVEATEHSCVGREVISRIIMPFTVNETRYPTKGDSLGDGHPR